MSTPPPADPAPDADDADADLRTRLTPLQYDVTQRQGTERAFTGEYWDCHDDGTYHCVVCGEPLFSSESKYDSGSGWPSFTEPMGEGAVEARRDVSHGMVRDEVVCGRCGAHLGHVFPDGPQPTGERYCMNSASLRLARDAGDDATG
jgi:peptide-methionine (R)-S-oxide reductase